MTLEATRLAAAAAAVLDAFERFEGPEVDEVDLGIVVRVSASAEVARTIERVVEDVARRFEVPIAIDWR